MKEELSQAYIKRLNKLFSDSRKHLKSIQFGADKAIIETTIPLMVFENWREDGHQADIPLLDECVKNTISATVFFVFGWKKTCYLHLRLILENAYYSFVLLCDKTQHKKFITDGSIRYRKFQDLVNAFINYNAKHKKVNSKFKIKTQSNQVYDNLSKWSHSLGEQFFSDLSILGKNNLDQTSIGEIKKLFKLVIRIVTIIYLTSKPSMLGDLSASNQRRVMQHLTVPERSELRSIIEK